MTYYLQLEDNFVWEEVDSYTFENMGKALNKDGNPRYNGNYVRVHDDGTINIVGSLDRKNLAIVNRILAIKPEDCPQAVTGGFVRNPEFIKFEGRKGGKIHLHEVATGANFKVA